MTLSISALYAMPLAIIYVVLFFRVTLARSKAGQSLGDGGNVTLHENIRRHGNFVEWVPMVMIMLILAEAQGADAIYLHVTGALLVLGRVLHPFGLKANNANHPLRLAGNSANLLALGNAFICLAVKGLGY